MKKSFFTGTYFRVLVVLILIFLGILIFFRNSDFHMDKVVLKTEVPSESFVLPTFLNYSYKDLNVLEASKLVNESSNNSLFIVDVSSDYFSGHIKNSINYPFVNGSFKIAINNFDNKKIYLIYSRIDIDSLNAAKLLSESGFDKVYRLRGNYGAWVSAGYAISH